MAKRSVKRGVSGPKKRAAAGVKLPKGLAIHLDYACPDGLAELDVFLRDNDAAAVVAAVRGFIKGRVDAQIEYLNKKIASLSGDLKKLSR